MSNSLDNQIDVLENELQITQIVSELDLKRKILDDTKKALREAQTNRHDLEQELEIEKHRTADYRTKLELALATLRRCEQEGAEATGKEAMLECVTKERDAFKKRLREVQQRNDELESQLEEMRNKNNSNDIRRRGLYEQIEQFKLKENSVNQYIQDHRADEAQFKKDLMASKRMALVLQNTIKYYKELNEKYMTEKQNYIKEITKYAGQVKSLQVQNMNDSKDFVADDDAKEDVYKTIAYLRGALEKERETTALLTIQSEERSLEDKQKYEFSKKDFDLSQDDETL